MLWLAAVVGAIVVDRAFKRAQIDADAVGMVAIAVVAGHRWAPSCGMCWTRRRNSGKLAGGAVG